MSVQMFTPGVFGAGQTLRFLCLVLVICGAETSVLAGGQSDAFEPPRTEWGDPDFRGHYLPGGAQPLETPSNRSWQPSDGANRGKGAAFSRFFEPDAGATPRPERVTTPMVIDTPSGQIPFQPWAAARRGEIMARQDALPYVDRRVKCLP